MSRSIESLIHRSSRRERSWAAAGWATAILVALLLSGRSAQAQMTDAQGQILGENWLILGPFSNPFACNGIAADLLGNHIAPSEIACQYPEDGDEIDYDPAQSVSTGYVGPTGGGGGPIWRVFTAGAGTGNMNLDGDVNGDQIDVVSFLATYIEYTGPAPTVVQFCVGSDDGVQVWLDDQLLHNNSACRATGYCEDVVGAVIAPGVHCIKMGIWENEGGWGGSLGLTQNGLPIVDDGTAPDWAFLGSSGAGPAPACDPPTEFPQRVIGATCVKRIDGGLDVTWINPPDANTAVAITIYAAGFKTGTVPGTATSAIVAAADLNDQSDTVCVVNSSGLASCCTADNTDAAGHIKSSQWLVLGPFSQTFACNGNNTSLLGNHIAPSCIQGQYPVVGTEINYDPGPAVTSAYVGPPSAGDKPYWRAFDDGSDDGDQNLDADVNGDQNAVMSWLATYIEYKGDDPASVELCLSSDDGIQVWLDDKLAHNNNACRGRDINLCQDLVPITISKGPHRIAVGVWENGGGWGATFALQQAGVAITDDTDAFPDWQFWGRAKPPGFQDIPCPACLEPVSNVQCKLLTGFPSGLEVTWTIPPACNLALLTQHSVRINGVEVATVAPTASRVLIPTARVPDGFLVIDVVNSSGFPATCCFQSTDDQGLILTNKWLVLGPFQEPFGCNGDSDSILGNHIAPSHICQQYPQEGDAIDYDPAQSVSSGYIGPTDASNNPIWRAFDDGTPCDGDNNLDTDSASNDVMSWMATYVEYTGDGSIDLELCAGSDDGVQVWMDDTLIHNNNACRGRAVCQDIVPFSMPQGVHRFAIGAWENDGGWGLSLGLRDANGPIVDDGTRDDFIFHGRVRPGEISDFPACSPPCPAVQSLVCTRNGDGSVGLSWQNPDCDAPQTIAILVNGAQVGTTAATATTFTIPSANLPGGVVTVTVDNNASRPARCGILNDSELYINCGGAEFVDTQGRVWLEDSLANPSPFLTSVNAFTADFGNPAGVNLTADAVISGGAYPAEILPVERWNDGPIEYTISGFPSGDYEVTLLFMEGCCSEGCEDIPDPALSAGTCRVFDVYLNDQLVEDQFAQTVIAAQEAGVAPAIGQLLALIYQAMITGTWQRLKICRNDECRWAYYDRSRNRSGAWCTMAVCGNRMKGRTFRRRRVARSAG